MGPNHDKQIVISEDEPVRNPSGGPLQSHNAMILCALGYPADLAKRSWTSWCVLRLLDLDGLSNLST